MSEVDHLDEGWSIDQEESALPRPAIAGLGSRIWWTLTGLLLGIGIIAIAFGWIGVFLALASVATGWVAVRRFGWGTSAPGWVALGVVPSAILTWAAATERGCPDKGKFFILDEGDAPVSCSEVVASYTSMAVFFALIAIIGAFVPAFVRRQRRLALAERAEQARDEH